MRLIINSKLDRTLLSLCVENRLSLRDTIEQSKRNLTTEEKQEMGIFSYQFSWYVLIEEKLLSKWRILPYEIKKGVSLFISTKVGIYLVSNNTYDMSSIFSDTDECRLILEAEENIEKLYFHPAKAIF